MRDQPAGRCGAGEAQHEAGKLTARERLDILLDEGSFEELDRLAGDGVVTGLGTISGRTTFVFAQDVCGLRGSPFEAQAPKIAKVQDMALRSRAPIIGLYESDGVRVRDGLAALAGFGDVYRRQVLASGVVPQISVIMGPCAGADALSPALGDFTFMVRGTSHLFVGGPGVLKAVTNETMTAEALGGASIHTETSALADGAYANDVEALLQVRRLVDFLPASNVARVPAWPAPPADADDPSLDTLVPGDPLAPFDVKELIAKLADDGDVFEIGAAQARNLVVAFGRVEGRTVGFVANQPNVLAGVLDGAAARKAARFVRFCDCFGLPLVTLVDVPGFLPTVDEEHGGLARHGAKLLYAYAEATVPKITVVTGRAFGPAYAAMASKPLGGDLDFAWPGAQIARRGAASDAAFAAAAQCGAIDEVIQPRETRRKVARSLAALRAKASEIPWKKHGNISL